MKNIDGAVRYDDLLAKIKKKQVSLYRALVSYSLEKLSTIRRRSFQYCLIPFLEPKSPKRFLDFRAIQGHSGGTLVDPTLQDKCTDSRGLRRVHPPHRERDRHALCYQQ